MKMTERYNENDIKNKDSFELSSTVNNSKNRIKNSIETLNYNTTQNFFKNRASKFNEDNPYSVTMYQDNNPGLVKERNAAETGVLKPLLGIDNESRILDIACGIGRWSDSINQEIKYYCGIDFSKELIDIAKKRNADKQNRAFFVGAANETRKVIEENNQGKFNIVLLIGILIYLNDNDLTDTLAQICEVSDKHATICIREPIGIEDRLTLKDFYSNELKDNYNAIYRTRSELMQIFEKTLLKNGFSIVKESFLFDKKDLNNRSETEQYYYIFRR